MKFLPTPFQDKIVINFLRNLMLKYQDILDKQANEEMDAEKVLWEWISLSDVVFFVPSKGAAALTESERDYEAELEFISWCQKRDTYEVAFL